MKTVSDAFRAWLNGGAGTKAICWLCKQRGGTVLAFTNHDKPLTFNLASWMASVSLTAGPGVAGTGSQTYLASTGFLASDLQSGSSLAVDSGEAQGILSSPAITEADMLAGLWDYCRITIFMVNWADLSMGAMILRTGTLGEITTDKGFFKAEWRSLSQAYAQNIGQVDSPSCNANLGDDRCTVNLDPLTVSGVVEGVNPDTLTFYDSALIEPGPTGGVAITGITNANPGRITMASAGTFANGDPVNVSGIIGPTLLNTTMRIAGLSGTSWSTGIDTTDTGTYPAYGGGGTVTPLGSTAGWFDAGVVTWLSGDNTGLSEVVKAYAPGQVTLQLPMPYAVQVGDIYTIVAGCTKSVDVCRLKFNNVINFRGQPFFPGRDFIQQVGRRS